jgi:hypothetical protein
METVLLRSDGTLCEAGRPITCDPLEMLGRAVELDGGYRLRSFFRLLLTYPDLVRLSPFLPGFVEKYPGWPEKSPVPFGLDFLRLDKTVEMIGHPGPPRLEIYASLHGISGCEMLEIKSHPVETLLDAPLALGACLHKVFGDRFEDMAFMTVFCLFEFIEAISWQLTFHGSPMECALRR